jgi:hypothetical protein
MAKKINRPNSELALIYSSLSETCQDLNDLNKALEYYDLEMKTNSMDIETVKERNLLNFLKQINHNIFLKECKSLLNIAIIKEKLSAEFNAIKEIYMKAYKKAKEIVNNETSLKLQVYLILLIKYFFYSLKY